MPWPEDRQGDSCGGCVRCGPTAPRTTEGSLRGWRVALSAAGAFLLPPASALVGALLVGRGEGEQFLGAMGGMLLGIALAAIGARALAGDPKDHS